MKIAPGIKKIKNWLRDKNPLGLFSGAFQLGDIDPKPWSGHFNFLISTDNKKLVLRFKGPEWGDPLRGVVDEYEILQAVQKYNIGPKVYYLTQNFFGEPAMLQEYLHGRPLNELPGDEQVKIFPKVARLIAKINSIKLPGQILEKQEQIFSYEHSMKSWQERLKIISENAQTKMWGKRIEKLMPKAEKMLNRFDAPLKQVMKKSGPVFIFKSAHIGHCIKTAEGLRFLNWEKNGYGDPSLTLAVFLASIEGRPDFLTVKNRMITTYLEEKSVPNLARLVEQRLQEREISNLLWVLWAYVNQNDIRPVEEVTDAEYRLEKVQKILAEIS